MADVIRWVSKAGKAIAMSTFEYVKELNPTISAFGYAANDLKYNISETVGNLKDKANKEDNLKHTSEFVTDIMKNLKNDIKEANFGDKESDDFDFDDDFGGDFDFSDDDYDEETSEADRNTKFTTDIMKSVSLASTQVISGTTAKSAQYMIKSNTANTKALINNNIGIFEKVNAGLATINHNIINIDNFNRTVSASHYQNSVNFYSATLDLLKENNSMMKELLELQKSIYTPKKSESRQRSIDDFIDADGVFNLGAVKNSLKEDWGDFFSIFFNGEGIKKSAEKIKEHPLKFITDNAVKAIFPKMLAGAMKDFNTTLKGATSTALMKLNSSGGFATQMILSLLGLGDFGARSSLSTNQYTKTAIPFDGITKKSIVEVIPTYLSKIYSAISGQKETRYDFDKGEFVDIEDIQKRFDKITTNRANSIARSAGIEDYFSKYMESLDLSRDRLESLKKDYESIIIKNFKDESLFDHRDSVEKIKNNYELSSEDNAKIIKAMWESLPTRVKMSYAGELYSGMENHNRELRNIEENGYSSYLSLFNNSINKNKDTKLNKELIQTKSPFQSNILTYLSNIADDVHNMKDVIIEGYKDKNNNGGIVKRIFSSKEKKTKPTVTNKTKKDEKTKDEEEPEPPNDDKSVSDYESKFSSLNADITDDEGLTRKHNQIRDIIEQGYSEATTKKEKLHVFTDNAKEIAKHPVQFISAILNIAEDKLYDLVFGKDKNGKSVIDTINENIKKTFEDSKKWLSEKVNIAKEKVKETVNKENIHNQVVKFFNVFGVDIDDITRNIRTFFFGRKNADGIIEEEGLFTNIFGRVKNQFSGIFKYIKNAFSDVIDFLGFASIKKKSAKFKEDKTNKIQEILNKINKSSTNKNESNPDGTGEVEQAAEGIKKVKRTGAVIVSKGEYILPPDMNPYNIKERYKNENKAKEKFILNYGENPALFAEGGEYNPDIDEQVKKWYEEGLNKEEIIKKLKEMENNYKLKKEDYERAPFVMRMQEEATKIIDQLKAFTSDVKGKIPKKDVPDQIQSISKDLMSNIKEYFPSMLAGGVLGGGVSLITGMVGGPLLGAAVGASAALIKKSDAIQEVLFGKMTDDGTRDGSGLVSKKMTKALDKYLPTVLKGATVGGILGITPLIPGGPLAGIMLGSAIGYAQKNEQIQEYLFGEFGVLGKDFKKKVQSALPKVGLGALAGLVAGPFGVTTNILLGSALGFASDTELFKGTIFGNKDKDGKTYGGILQMIREGVVDPMGEFFKESTVTFRNWFKKDIMDPVTNAIQPLTKQVQMMMQSIFEFSINKIKGFFGRDTDGLFAKMIRQNFIDPIVGFTKGSINVLSKPVGGLLSIPSKAIGYAGDHFRRQHVRRGTATYMTAAERIAYREEGNLNRGLWGNGNIIHNDNFADADQIIANMSVDELEQARRGFTYARNASTASKQEMREASSKIGGTLNSMNNISVKAAKTVQKFIKNGQLDKAIQFINTLNIDDNQKEQLLEVVKTEGKRYNDAKEAKEDVIGTREKMYEVLKDMGFKDIKLNNLKKYENLLLAEQMARDPKQEEENDKINEEMKKQDTRHIEIMDVIREATAYLRIMSNPNKEQREAMYDSTIKDIRNSINDGKTEKESKKTIFDKINSRQENIQKEAKEDTKKEVKEDTKKEEEKQENIQNEVKEDTKKEEETKEKDESKKPIWQFEQGLPLKYYKTKDGDIKPDTGHSDTKLNLFKLDKQRKAEEESANTQKSILEKITGIPSMLGEIFNSGKDEKPSALKGLLSKALKVAGVATVVGALPYIYDMYKEKVAPWLQDKFNISSESINEAIANGAKTIVRKIAGVVFGDKETMGIVPWIQQKGIPWFTENALPKIVNYYINGFDFLLTKVVPKMAEMIIVNLPSIGIGILKGIGGLLDNLFNMFENKDIKNGSTSTMGKTGMGITKSESLGSNTLTSTTKLVDVSNAVSGSWDTGNNINQAVDSFNSEINSSFSNSNNTTTGGQVKISSEKTKSTGGATSIGGLGTGKVDETMFNSNKERTKKAKEIVKVNNTARKNSNMQLIQGKDSDKVIEAIAPYLDSYVTLDDGTTCTVAELLTSEKTITYQNVDGNEYAVRGVDILSDPTIAKNIFGVDISLSKQERKDNSTHGFSDSTKYLGKVGAIDLVKGTGGAGKLVKIGGRLVQGTSILTKLNKPFSVITGSIGNNMVKGGDALSKLSKNSGGILKGVASDIANLQKVRSIDSSIKSVSQSRYLAGLIDNAESLVGKGNISSIQEAIDINNYLKSRPATEALSEAADIATDNIINEGSEQAVKNATGAAAEAAEKAASLNMTEKTVKEIAEEVVENSTKKKGLISKIASKVTSKLSSSTDGMIKKITTALYDQIIKFFADSRIVKLVSKLCTKYNENIPKKVAEIGKTIAEKIAKKFGENAAKNTTKVFAKLATWLTGPFKVAFLVADFIYGYNNVYNILGITKNSKYHVSIAWKIISGLVNVFNSSFCMGLIPFDLIFDTICNIGEDFGWFENNEEMQELLKAREESESEVNKYNTENGTDYDVDEYNDKDKLMTKIVSTGNKILSGVGNVFKGAYTTITGKDTKETTTTDSNTNQTTATDNTSTYQDTVVYQDSNMASIPSGSGSGLKEKILEIDKKLKEQREEKLKTSNLSSKKITKPIIAKTSDVTVYNKNKTSTTIDETATDSLNVIKKLPDILMDKLINPTDDWLTEMQEPMQELILESFNKSFVTPMQSMFSIFAKLIYSISNSNVITTLIGDPDTPSDTGLLGESTGSTTKTTGIVSKITSTIKNAWSGIKKFFGGSSGMNPDLFISQLDSAYNDSNIGGMSISDKGCGPASATMAINNTLAKYTGGYTDMNTEIGLANQYVSDTGDGVTADYFSDAFSRSGLDTNYMNNKSNIFDSIRAGKSTVLLGQDKNNTSKNNSPYGPGNHYIVANGMSDDGKTIYINDPESNVSNIPYKTEKILNHTQLGISPEIPSAGKSALKIHKKKPKIYYMYYGGDAQNIDGTPTGSTSSTVDGDYVGRYTKSFESGSKGSKATDSCGADGGASFGSYQMTYKHGLARQFMKKYYPDIFNASKWDSGASAAKQLWLAAVNSDPANFFAHEHEFIGEQYYEVGKNLIKSFFNPDTHSRAMQDCIWSWSVHRGPSGMKSGLKEAISTAGISDAQTCDETKLLNACYDQRQKSFAAAGYSKNAKNRYGTSGDSERNRLLALKGQKPIDPKSVNGQVISGDTTASTDGNTNTISNIFDMYNVLDNAFATAFGFNTSSSTSTDSSTTSGNSEGVVSAGATSQKVIDFAIKERPNVNYIYGSDNENTKTFDCSSFTKWVYKNAAGINLNRKSTSQHSSPGMKEIPFSQAQPGDIIEYNRPNTHVGLYMGGNKLIHNLNPSKDCVITEDLDSNGNRVRNDGSVNQYFYKAATIAEQPALNDTSSSTTTNTTFTQKANDVETSGAGSGLIRRRTNKKTKTISGNRNIINNELSKYKGGDTMLYRNFISTSSSNTLDDKTKLQAIKDTLHYLNSIDVNTNKLASIVELLTQIIGLISKIIENSSTNKQEMIEAQKEQINSMLNAVSSIITTSKASESSDDNYQLELLIKNVNNLIRE